MHSPALVVGIVEQLIAPLSKTIGKKPEAERALDLVRSGVRAVLAVGAIEDICQINRKWADFLEKVRRDELTAGIVRALESEPRHLEPC